MPRLARLDAAGVLHHVMIRGIEGRDIFVDDADRYKSIICQEDAYLQELVRYIHLNPLRARLVPDLSSLNTYAYCGHSALMGKKSCKWQDTRYVLNGFGKTVREARKRYLSFVEAGLLQGRRDDLVGGGLVRSLGGWAELKMNRKEKGERITGDERILGDGDFVNQVLSEAKDKYARHYELKRLGYDFKKISERVSDIYGNMV